MAMMGQDNRNLFAASGTTGSVGGDLTNRGALTGGFNSEVDVTGAFEDFGGSATGFADDIFGRTMADAIRQGALSQVALGEQGIMATADAQRRLEETLSPFVGVGLGQMNQAINLFGPNAAQGVMNDPAFQAAAERAQTQLLAQQASRGRLATAETAGGLSSALSNLGSDYLSRQRGDILGALQLGQASAAQQGASGLQTGSRQAEMQTNLGNILAASGIGQANALSQGTNNVAGIAGGIASIFSDPRLKRNARKTGRTIRGITEYIYQYLWDDRWFLGGMADEIKRVNPDAVITVNGFDQVIYEAL